VKQYSSTGIGNAVQHKRRSVDSANPGQKCPESLADTCRAKAVALVARGLNFFMLVVPGMSWLCTAHYSWSSAMVHLGHPGFTMSQGCWCTYITVCPDAAVCRSGGTWLLVRWLSTCNSNHVVAAVTRGCTFFQPLLSSIQVSIQKSQSFQTHAHTNTCAYHFNKYTACCGACCPHHTTV
jgi:hypothetical protein